MAHKQEPEISKSYINKEKFVTLKYSPEINKDRIYKNIQQRNYGNATDDKPYLYVPTYVA